MKEVERKDLHKIGHLRGVDQYEVLSDLSLLVLCCGDRYFLSKVANYEDSDHYSNVIYTRITLFYNTPKGENAFENLGEEIKVIEGGK